MTGLELIQQERKRQIEVEGWTSDHDAHHINGELKAAAFCYWGYGTAWTDKDIEEMWPWEKLWWKPNSNRIKNLIKSGALYMAENERTGTTNCNIEIGMLSRKIDIQLKYLRGIVNQAQIR